MGNMCIDRIRDKIDITITEKVKIDVFVRRVGRSFKFGLIECREFRHSIQVGHIYQVASAVKSREGSVIIITPVRNGLHRRLGGRYIYQGKPNQDKKVREYLLHTIRIESI